MNLTPTAVRELHEAIALYDIHYDWINCEVEPIEFHLEVPRGREITRNENPLN